MKKNSIEEIIKIIERKIKEAEHYTDITGLCLTLDKELCNAFINILSDYKRVLKENKEYYKQLDLDYTEKNFISKQKIKDKVDGLKQKAISYGPFIDKDESFSIESKISVLQELLESEE